LINAFLLDIEGTTTPVDFVYRVLFPYSKAMIEEFLKAHGADGDIANDIASLEAERETDKARGLWPPASQSPKSGSDPLSEYFRWLVDQDRKSTPLKSLQGRIWQEGYRSGELRSQVFEDVPRALAKWRREGKQIFIYSSGSVLAQKLLFANTDAGDLTKLIDGFFDTNVGPKIDEASYARIVSSVGVPAGEIMFVSDVTAELNAARKAGLQILLCLRPGNRPQADAESFMQTDSLLLDE